MTVPSLFTKKKTFPRDRNIQQTSIISSNKQGLFIRVFFFFPKQKCSFQTSTKYREHVRELISIKRTVSYLLSIPEVAIASRDDSDLATSCYEGAAILYAYI